MKKFMICAITLFWLLSTSVFGDTPPGNVQATFKKMYPKANGIAWSQDDGYYCANFVMNGFTKNVWFNVRGQWVMTQTDLVSLDRLSPAVYNAFVSGPYASWVVDNVTMVEFPKWQAIIVIKVGQDNVDIKYQLFYTPQGVLLKTRNVSDMYDILGPSTFLVNYWWLPLPILQNTALIAVNQPFINSCFVIQNQRGTKTGQNHGKIKSRTLRSKYPLWNTSVSFAKVQICPLKNEGKSLFLSFTTHFPTIVLQMWLLQAILTSNSMTCEYRVLNFVLHSVGHFQKRELAIEPKICHPYCPILGFGNV